MNEFYSNFMWNKINLIVHRTTTLMTHSEQQPWCCSTRLWSFVCRFFWKILQVQIDSGFSLAGRSCSRTILSCCRAVFQTSRLRPSRSSCGSCLFVSMIMLLTSPQASSSSSCDFFFFLLLDFPPWADFNCLDLLAAAFAFLPFYKSFNNQQHKRYVCNPRCLDLTCGI